jgi:hypothetical protein
MVTLLASSTFFAMVAFAASTFLAIAILGVAFIFLAIMAAIRALVGLDIGRFAHAVGEAVGARHHILARDVCAEIRVG